MNIPQLKVPVTVVPEETDLGLGAFVTNVLTDVLLAASYVLLLYVVVLLNRQKHVSIYIPKQTYMITFGVVAAVGIATTVAAMFVNAPTMSAILKLLSSFMMTGIAIGIWRILPRHVDLQEKAVIDREASELRQTAAELERVTGVLEETQAEFDRQLAKRTDHLTREKLDLEKQIVERRLSEERVSEAKRRMDELILRTSTASLLVDSEGSVLECNHALAQLVGRGTMEELVGRKLSRLLGLKNEQSLVHFTSETLRHGTFAAEFDAAPPARGVIHIEASGAASVIDGKPCVMALFRDVTERYKSEKELLQSREALTAALEVARQANATKSDFLAKMNHELRTPLNGIIGLSEILRHRAHAESLKQEDLRKRQDELAKQLEEKANEARKKLEEAQKAATEGTATE